MLDFAILVFKAKMSQCHNENDRPDGKTLKQNSPCMNTVLQNMNDNYELLLYDIK